MKTENNDKYQDFYAELPFKNSTITDYPTDIEITQAYDETPDQSGRPGLSAEQVSLIARDSLETAHQRSAARQVHDTSDHRANRS